VVELLGCFSHENGIDLSVKEGELTVCDGGNVYSYFDPRDYRKGTRKIARTMRHLVGFLKNRGIGYVDVGDKYIYLDRVIMRVEYTESRTLYVPMRI